MENHEKVMVSRFGLMVLDTKVNGKLIKHMAREGFSTQTAMCTRASGSKIQLMGMVLTGMLMGPSMKVLGNMIGSMAEELKTGSMVPAMMECTLMVASTAMVFSHGLMGQSLRDSSWRMTSREKDFIHGVMDELLRDNGNKIEWMVLESSLGLMVACMKANI